MTILDKEEYNLKNKKKKKKEHKLFYKLLSFILVVITVSTFVVLIINEILPIFYMLPIMLVLTIIIIFICKILNKEKLRCWIKNIFSFLSIIIISFFSLLLIFGTKTLTFLSNITDTGYRVESFGVYVLNTSNYKKLKDLDGKDLMYINHEDDENILAAYKKIDKKIKVNGYSKDTVEELIDSLINKETDAILMDISYETILIEEYSDKYELLKKIETIDIVDTVTTLKSNVNITNEPFAIYISGIDTTGSIATSARSDVNIILAVNPNTKNILMINTPRDYYVKFHTKGKMDKLTHAGIYGVEESLHTLEDLYDMNIDYYARLNFSSFIKIVNALDGVKVNVPIKFCEQNSHRSFKSSDLICLNKGSQTLNGEQALALARHRKTIGDRERGENQMLVLKSIINQAMSPKVITKYSSILKALEGNVTTNVTSDEIVEFAKKQIKNESIWKFNTISADGSDSNGYCEVTRAGKAYVMEPNKETVDNIKNIVTNLFDGKEVIMNYES